MTRSSGLLLIAVLWCSAPSIEAQNPVIGFVAELSGSNAANGISCKEGFDTARKWLTPEDKIDGYSIQYEYGDHRGDSTFGVTEFRRLVDTKNAIAIVMTRSSATRPVNPLSKAAKVPILATVGQRTLLDENPHAFRFWISGSYEGSRLAERALAEGKRKAAVITLEDEYTLSLSEGFKSKFTQGGGSIVYDDTITPDEADISTRITRLRTANPDVLNLNLTIGQLGTIIRKLREQGLQQPILSNLWAGDPAVIKAAGTENIEGLVFVSPNLHKPKFLSAYKAMNPDGSPIGTTYMCYAALTSIIQAMHSTKDIVTGEQMSAALSALPSVTLLDETVEIRNRELVVDLSYNKIVNGIPVPQ